MMTEDEAKAKQCPIFAHAGILSAVAAGLTCDSAPQSARDETAKMLDNQTKCIASACMVWRKDSQIGIGPNGEKRDRDMDGRTRWVDTGHCGLAGKP